MEKLPLIGGQKVVVLRRQQTGDGSKPEFLSVTLLPGRGMNMFQITAYLPGHGEIPLLTSPSLTQAAHLLNGGPGDENGNESFSMGGAFLFPFANRIRGPLTQDKKFVIVTWKGRKIELPANFHGKLPGAPLHAIHGNMLAAKADNVNLQSGPLSHTATATYTLPANGHWFSDNHVRITVTLSRDTVTAQVTATNSGQQSEPVGIGWHPYFQLPSGSRANARVHVPAMMRVVPNNYDDVFPTGKLVPVMGTPYDFNAAAGAPLPDKLVDDSFVKLERTPDGHTVCSLRDLGANYGMRITAMTPEVRAVQVYSPANKSFVAIEPQFNYGDPFGDEWHGVNTGMVTLVPGQSVTWKTQLQLFQPADEMIGQPMHPQVQ